MFAGVNWRLETRRRYFLFLYYLELLKQTNRRKQYKRQNNLKICPSKRIWSTTVRNTPSSHSINRVFVFVGYANKLSPTLKSSMFASACSDCPDFLFEILIEEAQRVISMLISIRYRTYQDTF